MIYSCYFCKNDITDENEITLTCHKCPVKVVHHVNWILHKLMAVNMKTEFNGKTIDVYIGLDSVFGPYCDISEITKPVPNKQNSAIVKLPTRISILQMEGVSSITPHNIKEKLKLYLTFL